VPLLDDITDEAGMVEPLLGMYGHAVATADVNGDGWLDIFVGTFADKPADRYQERGADGPSPDRLLLGGPDGFHPGPDLGLDPGRSSGAVFADLDGDGDPDLVVSRNAVARGDRPAASAASVVIENDGGHFTVAGELVPDLAARGIAVLDADGDGRLDLFVTADPLGDTSSVLLHNEGGLRFTDSSVDAGVPDDLRGLAVVAADLDADGHTDLVVPGDPRVLRGDGAGHVVVERVEALVWEGYGDEDLVAGADVGDLDGDGLVDLVIGQHFNSTVDHGCAVPVRVYRNTSEGPGALGFEEVTGAAGIPGFPTKAPHIELVDMDDDGWLDIVTSASAADGDGPAILRNLGRAGPAMAFATPPGMGSPQYWVTGATGDFDGDGRLDLFLLENDPALPSRLWRNTATEGGAIDVTVPLDADGVGAVVEVYEAGHLGDANHRIARREVVVGRGYAAGAAGVVHVGVGQRDRVDVLVASPRGGAERVARSVTVGARLVYPGDFR
jgi:hypothetical protein